MSSSHSGQQRSFNSFFIRLAAAALTVAAFGAWRSHASLTADNPVPVVTVPAASFESTAVAPDSIAAAFGSQLATQTAVAASLPLPTELGGTTVEINGRRAGLFFVSSFQINFLVPTDSESGSLDLVVRAGDGVVSRGTVAVSRVAPAIFTANNDGQGVPAAALLRIRRDGAQIIEPLSQPNPINGRQTTRPIDLGPEGERVFLILFLSGISRAADPNDDGNRDETIRVIIGGHEAAPLYAGSLPNFAGLDQINVELPRSLIGRGRVNLAVNAAGYSSSNLVEIEIAGTAGNAPPQISGFSAASALAGQVIQINGSGFAPNPRDNLARIAGIEARVSAATSTRLTVVTPFGAETGRVSVRTPQGEALSASLLTIRPSISGFVETTARQPIKGVTARVVGANIAAVTNAEGFFLLPDVAPGLAVIEVDGATAPVTPPYPKMLLSLNARANRDNPFARPIALQQTNGREIRIASPSLSSEVSVSVPVASLESEVAEPSQVGEVTLQLPPNVSVRFPDGATSGTITITMIENGRLPVALPFGVFNSAIAQLTPFGAILTPGARLFFPNSDGWPVGTRAKLFRLDQKPDSPTVGRFIEAGVVTVVDFGNGNRWETEPGAITETGCYFFSTLQPTTTIVGRVVASDGATPVRQALARARGQEAFTDGDGSFILRYAPVKPNELISVDVSYLRADGRIDRTQRHAIAAIAGGVTRVWPDLTLTLGDSNRPPVILAPTTLSLNSGEIRHVSIVATDPDIGQTVQLGLSGAGFATLSAIGNDVYGLRLAPRQTDFGQFTLTLTATDNLGVSATHQLVLTINRPPAANDQSVTTDEDTPKTITLAGSDPDGNQLSFAVVSHPSHGSLSGTAPNLTYAPAANYNGSDSFTFKVSDGMGESRTATVSIAINPVNDRPMIAAPSPQPTLTGDPLNFVVYAYDVDEGQTLALSVSGAPGDATFKQMAPTSAQFNWTPSATQHGNYTLTFTVSDNGAPALSDSVSVALTVLGRWTATGTIEGGEVRTFFSNGANLFAGAGGGGVFRSTDQGQSWRASNEGLSNAYVDSFVVVGGTLIAASHGVYRSTDQGQTWRYANNLVDNGGLPHRINSLVAIGTTLFGGTGGGVYRSTDLGDNWTAVNQGLTDLRVRVLALSGATLFAGTDGGGVFRSTDQGQTWAASSVGLPPNTFVRSILTSGQNLIATTNSGVFLSSDQGQRWRASDLTDGGVSPLAVSGSTVWTVGCCLYRSTNQGQNWSRIAENLPIGVASLIAQGGQILAGTWGGGVLRPSSDGQRWTASNTGLTAARIRSLITIGSNVVAGSHGLGVLRSTNQGQTWSVANSGLTTLYINAFVVSGASLFAAGGGVHRSTNQGQNWTPVNEGLTNFDVRALAVIGTTVFAGTYDGVFRSTSQGSSWTPINAGLTDRRIVALAAVGTKLFAGTDGGGVFCLPSQGQNWAPCGLTGLRISSFAVMGQTLFASTYGSGVYRSTDQGQNWTPLDTSVTGNWVDVVAASNTQLFAANGGGVYISLDEGKSWMRLSSGLTNTNVGSFGFSSAHMFAGTFGGGVFIRPL